MRLLVTNDDGLHAPGLLHLARAARDAGHDVLAVAPEGDWSGSAAAIGNLGERSDIRCRGMPLDGLEEVESYELDAPPALCVIAAGLGAFGDPPELVLSGVNPGLNTGRSTQHSGTVGAALTARHFGVSGVAVSIDGHEHSVEHWEVAAALGVRVGEWAGSSAGPLTLNVSVPDRPMERIRRPVHGKLARLGAIRTEVLGRTEERLELGFRPTGSELPDDVDTSLAAAGHLVITPLTGVSAAPFDLTAPLIDLLAVELEAEELR